MLERRSETTHDSKKYIQILKKVQETTRKIRRTSEKKFSTEIEPKKARVNILLHPLAQLYTTPEPEDVVDYLKKYFCKALRDEGIDIERKKVDDVLEPILKDFLEDIFEMAEKSEVELPNCYEKLYERLQG